MDSAVHYDGCIVLFGVAHAAFGGAQKSAQRFFGSVCTELRLDASIFCAASTWCSPCSNSADVDRYTAHDFPIRSIFKNGVVVTRPLY